MPLFLKLYCWALFGAAIAIVVRPSHGVILYAIGIVMGGGIVALAALCDRRAGSSPEPHT